MPQPTLFFVFDVESVGLHGEGFAVGFIVQDADGNELETGRFACHPNAARGSKEGAEWVASNIRTIEPTHTAPWLVRAAFWRRWREWQGKGAVLVADCAWPVEARFLMQCVDDSPIEREWQGPYPLHDLASITLARRGDPLAKNERAPIELPEHDPLCDARQSARLLHSALQVAM